MMEWDLFYLPEAVRDLKRLDHSVAVQVQKTIRRVQKNPYPKQEGGYGTPLGNRMGIDLTGCMKIKFRRIGIRVVYKLMQQDGVMKIIVVSARADNEVYRLAEARLKNNDL